MWEMTCPKCSATTVLYQEGFLLVENAQTPMTCPVCGFSGTAIDFGYDTPIVYPTLAIAYPPLTNEFPEYCFVYAIDEATRKGIQVRVYVYDNPTIAETIREKLTALFPTATIKRIDVSARQVFYEVTKEIR